VYAAVRPYATAGIALLGAGVIAVSPLAPPMPHIQAVQRAVSSAGVELDAMVNPIERWVQVLSAAGANIGTITQAIIDNPTPILAQVIANQMANAQQFGAALQLNNSQILGALQNAPKNLQAAQGLLQAGDITGAVTWVNDKIVVPIVTGVLMNASDSLTPLVNMSQEFATVMAQIPAEGPLYGSAFMTAVLPMTYPLVSAVNALAQTTQDVVTGVGAGNVAAAVNALVNAPANLVGAILNGYGTVTGFPAAGILTPWDSFLGPLDSGPIASLNALREQIAEALGATPPAAAASAAVTPAAAISAIASVPTKNKTVTLSTTPSTSVSTNTALVKAKAKAGSFTGSAGSAVSGTPATVSGTPAGSVVKSTQGSAKPGTAQDAHSHAAKAGKAGKSGK
jgi:hypothetical protein